MPVWMLVVLMLLPVAACQQKTEHTKPLKIPVRVQQVMAHGEQDAIHYSANITPNAQVNLNFKVNGYINQIAEVKAPNGTNMGITQGDPVKKGLVLAAIDDREYRDKVKQAEANLGSAQAQRLKAQQDYKRAKILYAQQSMTAPDYDTAVEQHSSAKENVSGARAELDQARQNLAYCQLKAPFTGVLLSRNIEIGSLVLPSKEAFVLADLSSVKVEFSVPDVMLKNIQLGDSLSITTRSLPGQSFTGEVTAIAPAASQQTRVFDIDLSIDNPEHTLKANMVAELQINKLQLPVVDKVPIEIPIDAVVRSKDDRNGYAVYVVSKKDQNSYAKLQNIEPGEIHGNRIIVISGLNQQDRVIVSGVNTVWDGSPVNVIK